MKKIHLHFDSLEKCIEYASQPTPDYVEKKSRKVGDEIWSGAKSWEHALDIARQGVNTKAIETTIGELSIGSRPQEMVHSVAGSYVDIGAYLDGEPECMVEFQQNEEVKFIDIKFLFSENAGVSADVFTNKAIVLASIVDRLEATGYRVRLVACCRCGHRHGGENFDFDMDIVVKDYMQNLSLALISGAVSASFFRRIMFGVIERIYVDAANKNANAYGYGASADWRSHEKNDGSLLIGRHYQPHDFSDKKKLKGIIDSICKAYEF